MSKRFTNIEKMREVLKMNQGFDLVVIVSSGGNSKYWEKRLLQTRDYILPQKTRIICLEEDWNGNAGQLLGTLYAFLKANKVANLQKILDSKGTVAIYHTAGHGKRMAPLTAVEGNNKPAIKLPRLFKTKKGKTLSTILEAVIFSTQIFAKSREGRISVFWGDQIIIPSNSAEIETKLAVEIFGIKKRLVLERKEWNENWKDYGILIPQKEGEVLQREKVEWEKIAKLQERGYLKPNADGKVDISRSMGCFSIDFLLLQDLLIEFSDELKAKQGTLDTDPHLWMPLTSSKEGYIETGGDVDYFERIKRFKKKFRDKTKIKRIVGEKNLGEDTIWWDYGNVADYYRNLLLSVKKSEEGHAARKFFGIGNFFLEERKTANLNIKSSIIIDSEIKEGNIENSILICSKIAKADLKDAILIGSEIKKVEAENSIFYLIKENKDIRALPKEVFVDVKIDESRKTRMRTYLSRDGKKDWKIKLPGNDFSYSEIEKLVASLVK